MFCKSSLWDKVLCLQEMTEGAIFQGCGWCTVCMPLIHFSNAILTFKMVLKGKPKWPHDVVMVEIPTNIGCVLPSGREYYLKRFFTLPTHSPYWKEWRQVDRTIKPALSTTSFRKWYKPMQRVLEEFYIMGWKVLWLSDLGTWREWFSSRPFIPMGMHKIHLIGWMVLYDSLAYLIATVGIRSCGSQIMGFWLGSHGWAAIHPGDACTIS